ncbi:MAG: hypothetical protein AB1489_31120 [Acidobacteriota bacterium]
MPVNNNTNVNNVSNVDTTNSVNSTDNQSAQTSLPKASIPSSANTAAGRTSQDMALSASLMKSQISANLTTSTSGGTSGVAPNPSLNPRATFTAPLNDLLSNSYQLRGANNLSRRSTVLVNSANTNQVNEITFRNNPNSTMKLFYGLPPTRNVPAQTTADLPTTVFSRQGILDFLQQQGPLTDAQRAQVRNVYKNDLTSNANFAVNVQNLASALTAFKNSSCLTPAQNRLIDQTNAQLCTFYNQLANVPNGGQPPDADKVYDLVGKTISALSNAGNGNQAALNTAKDILSIGVSNYELNRLPVNGTSTFTANPGTGRYPLPTFNAAKPLSQAQAQPSQVFGQQVVQFLAGQGIKANANNIVYQVNSADKLQSVQVPNGNGQTVTVQFNGFPVTNANPAQFSYSGNAGQGISQYLRTAKNDPATAARVQAFFQANAAPRAAYVVNLQNITSLLQQVSGGRLPAAAAGAINNTVKQLQTAVAGLNATPPKVPDVLALYQMIGRTVDTINGTARGLNSNQRTALDALNNSALEVGVINYFNRAVTLSQPATT